MVSFEDSETEQGGGLPIPFVAHQVLSELFETSNTPQMVREVQICPVGIGRGENDEMSGFASFPIAHHLSKATPPPSFSNKKEDWSDFIRKYDLWCRNLSGGKTLSDSQQLQLLNSCLPEILQKEVQLWEREKGKKLTFTEFYAHLEMKFGRAQSESMRKRWLDVQMPKSSGKYSVHAFDEFRVNFKLACADVPDTTKEEARRVLFDKLLPFMKKWVVEAEAHLEEKSHL